MWFLDLVWIAWMMWWEWEGRVEFQIMHVKSKAVSSCLAPFISITRELRIENLGVWIGVYWQSNSFNIRRRWAEHTLFGNLSLTLQIALIAHHDDWEIILILDSENLLLENQDFVK